MRHLQHRKDSCGREWEKDYWKETVRKWDNWDIELQAGLMIKWIELYWKKKLNCEGCGKLYKEPNGMRKHVRKDKSCMKKVEEIMKKFPLGFDEEED